MNSLLPPVHAELVKLAEDNRRTRLVHILLFFGHYLDRLWTHSPDFNLYITAGMATCILLVAVWLHSRE